jgi:hypothetical protein
MGTGEITNVLFLYRHTSDVSLLTADKGAVGLFTSVKHLFQAQQELVKQLSTLPRDNYNLLSYICR